MFLKNFVTTSIFLLTVFLSKAGDTAHLYNPSANATAEIAKAVLQAKKENKFVRVQAGGNWYGWCLRFNKFVWDEAQNNKQD